MTTAVKISFFLFTFHLFLCAQVWSIKKSLIIHFYDDIHLFEILHNFFFFQNKKEFSKNILKWRKIITAIALARNFLIPSTSFYSLRISIFSVRARGSSHLKISKTTKKNLSEFFRFFFSLLPRPSENITQKKISKIKIFSPLFSFLFFIHTNYRRIYTSKFNTNFVGGIHIWRVCDQASVFCKKIYKSRSWSRDIIDILDLEGKFNFFFFCERIFSSSWI